MNDDIRQPIASKGAPAAPLNDDPNEPGSFRQKAEEAGCSLGCFLKFLLGVLLLTFFVGGRGAIRMMLTGYGNILFRRLIRYGVILLVIVFLIVRIIRKRK